MITAILLLFLGSAGLGGWYASLFAPESWLASAIGSRRFPSRWRSACRHGTGWQ
jgi:hypothetical protein